VHRELHDDEAAFTLTGEQCRDLRAEASMFYHRYLALFVLEDYEGVRRDTARNLAVIDMCRRFGPTARDRMVLDQFRPYIIMMHTRACVHISAGKTLWTRALAEVEEGLRRIHDYFVELQSQEEFARCAEARLLRRLRRQIRRRISADPTALLSRRLDRAVREERYEEAARLRDQLRDQSRQSVGE
jgi:protein-arginine kinase activator protein McsA